METKISAVIEDEHTLETIINHLLAESVSRADISIQGSSEQIKAKYGVSYISPIVIQNSSYPPTQEPFMHDDWGWVIGFSFAIPMFLGLIIGVFLVGDIQSTFDNFLFGALGLIIGSAVGIACATFVNKYHHQKTTKQEKKGGFVIWINTHNQTQQVQVMSILKEKNVTFFDKIH
jgi:hypothetical protein